MRLPKFIAVSVIILCLNHVVFAKDLFAYVTNEQLDIESNIASNCFRNLQQAFDFLLERQSQYDKLIILVEQGSYYDQKLIISEQLQKQLIIKAKQKTARPVFDGNNRQPEWIKFLPHNHGIGKVEINGLEITNYLTAISFNGNRDTMNEYNGDNIIKDNIFRNIGQFSNSNKPSTAAIRFVNSRNNKIINNQFINIKNIDKCGILHSIYFASNSSNNVVADNVFEDGCGATIKVRDSSNDNIIEKNIFKDQTQAVLLDAYCDKDNRTDCTKQQTECPSWNNLFLNNVLESSFIGHGKKIIQINLENYLPHMCKIPLGRKRVIELKTTVSK